ncbi:MAG: alkaline phosphatase PafA [Flavobacteriaceae bacterium]
MKTTLLSILILLFFTQCKTHKSVINPQNKTVNYSIDRPNLVIGIVVDQMRYDYLIRFYNKYGDGGFKRLMKDGYNCENAHCNFIPTYTAVGHTSIYTGATPSIHGIISNNWYDKYINESINCVSDKRYKTLGAESGGEVSPYRIQSTTISDQLKLAQINKGKVISISLKDRSAALSVGQSANAAYWFKGKNDAAFISSTFYMDELPKWVKDFNASGLVKSRLKVWNTLYPIDSYTESIEDDNEFEITFDGEASPTFPHNFPKLAALNGNYDLLKFSPAGNTIVVDFAKAAINAENLGHNKVTDFLAISFSSTDVVGHQYGSDSKEIEDTYLRLDKDLADFFNFLDAKVGEGNYTLFLTADHAVAPVPNYLKSLKINAGNFDRKSFLKQLNKVVFDNFKSKKIVLNFSNYQVFLDKNEIKKQGLDYDSVVNVICDEMLLFDGVYKTVSAKTLQNTNFTTGVLHALQNGYNQKISGDVMIIPKPGTILRHYPKGTTHGSGYSYDTHVPLLLYGKGIKKGNTKHYIPVIDIAPTLSNLLKIENPNGCEGQIIEDALE